MRLLGIDHIDMPATPARVWAAISICIGIWPNSISDTQTALRWE